MLTRTFFSPVPLLSAVVMAAAAIAASPAALAQTRRSAPATAQTPRLLAPRVFTGKVVRVSDGDTLTVLDNGRAVSLRLRGVDAPALNQRFGPDARKFLYASVWGKTVRVEARGDRDRASGLLLADVYAPTDVALGVRPGTAPGEPGSTGKGVLVPPRTYDPTGTRSDLPKGLPGPARDLPRADAPEESVGQALVRAGLAWADVRVAASDKTFADLQAQAQREKRGLWTDSRPTPPWQFRAAGAGASRR